MRCTFDTCKTISCCPFSFDMKSLNISWWMSGGALTVILSVRPSVSLSWSCCSWILTFC